MYHFLPWIIPTFLITYSGIIKLQLLHYKVCFYFSSIFSSLINFKHLMSLDLTKMKDFTALQKRTCGSVVNLSQQSFTILQWKHFKSNHIINQDCFFSLYPHQWNHWSGSLWSSIPFNQCHKKLTHQTFSLKYPKVWNLFTGKLHWKCCLWQRSSFAKWNVGNDIIWHDKEEEWLIKVYFSCYSIVS